MVERSLSAQYRDRGQIVVPGLLSRAEVDQARTERDRLAATTGLSPEAPIVTGPLSDPYLTTLVTAEHVTAAARELLAGPAEPFGATWLSQPGAGLPARWHQDAGPWAQRLGGAAALTLWIALDDVDAHNGCLQVIPGSHTLPTQPLRPAAGETNLFGVELDPALVNEEQAEDVVLSAGDVSVHHANLIHSSRPNRSGHPRRALALRFRARAS